MLHVLALTPFLVSTIDVESQRTPSMEAVGVTFVMAPLRRLGSPPPSPEPDHPELQPEVAEPVEVEPPAEAIPLMAKSLVPLSAPPNLAVLPRAIPRAVSLAASAAVAKPKPVAGTGTGGVGDNPPPPAIGAPSGQSNWAGLVLGRLEQFRRYPRVARRRRQEGICYVRFTIDREGHVLEASLERTSGHESLDREAVALVRRADPLPVPPPELEGETMTLTVPVEFFLTR